MKCNQNVGTDVMGNSLAGWLSLSRGKQLLQIAAIICIIFMMSVITHKGHHDISLIVSGNPTELVPALGRYFIGNLAGRGVEELIEE